MDQKKREETNKLINEGLVSKGINCNNLPTDDINKIHSQLQFTYGKISETRFMCTAYLGDLAIADGHAVFKTPEDCVEEIGIDVAVNDCSVNAYKKLVELEAYHVLRSKAEAAQKSKATIIT